jgi:hypothetical protein
VPEDAIEMARIPKSCTARHLLDCCPWLLQELLSGLDAKPRQDPFHGETGDPLEDSTQVGSAHAGRAGNGF